MCPTSQTWFNEKLKCYVLIAMTTMLYIVFRLSVVLHSTESHFISHVLLSLTPPISCVRSVFSTFYVCCWPRSQTGGFVRHICIGLQHTGLTHDLAETLCNKAGDCQIDKLQ